MDAGRNDHPHPDEGTIHAWLDGALDAPAAEALEAHVASCPSCAERVAEARGLIAGASRIVGALDDVPSRATPAWGSAPATSATHGSRSAWRLLRVTPARAAIAATILVAIGVTLTRDRVGPDTVREAREAQVMSAPASSSAPAVAEATPSRPRDGLLDSAVTRNLAIAQPPRAAKAAPGPELSPPAPAAGSPLAVADPSAAARVATGRAAALAQRETATVAADRAKVDVEVPTAGVSVLRGATKAAAIDASAPQTALSASVPSVPHATECYRVESANGTPATWGSDSLPFVVALDAADKGGRAHILVPGGRTGSGSRASWTRPGGDSLIFRLQRPGYQGTLALGGAGEVRAGVMRSAELRTALQEMVVTSADVSARAARQPARRARPATGVPVAPAQPTVAPAPEQDAASVAPAVAVVARRVGCSP
jgi:hypothetical protein